MLPHKIKISIFLILILINGNAEVSACPSASIVHGWSCVDDAECPNWQIYGTIYAGQEKDTAGTTFYARIRGRNAQTRRMNVYLLKDTVPMIPDAGRV